MFAIVLEEILGWPLHIAEAQGLCVCRMKCGARKRGKLYRQDSSARVNCKHCSRESGERRIRIEMNNKKEEFRNL